MKRDIKFRGFSIEGEWIAGGLLKTKSGKTFIAHVTEPKNMVLMTEVDPSTIGQYTGLKDREGKEIYEGDELDGTEYYGWVQFYDSGWQLGTQDDAPFGTRINLIDLGDMTVKGSIHDNPELLKP